MWQLSLNVLEPLDVSIAPSRWLTRNPPHSWGTPKRPIHPPSRRVAVDDFQWSKTVPMTTPASSAPEDPWDWNTDQVVTALCDPNAIFRATSKAGSLPDATFLEQKLREHFIEGPGLLTDLEHRTLRDDLGLKAVGHQGYIVREIRRLRRISQQYLEHIRQDDTSNPLAWNTSNFGTTRYATPFQQPTLLSTRQPVLPDAPVESTLAVAEVLKPPTPSLNATTPGGEGLSRLETSIQHSQEWLDQLPDIAGTVSPGSPAKPVEHQTLGRSQEKYIVDDNGRKRRRLVLSPLVPTILGDSKGPDSVDVQSTTNRDLERDLPPDDLSRQGATSKDKVLKRVTPILLSGPREDAPTVTTPTKSRLNLLLGGKPSECYLGVRALPVDDVFYERDIEVRSDWSSDEFAILTSPIGTGQRRYISSRIQYFLRQRAGVFHRGNKARIGICLYPDSLGRKHQPLSITIFESAPDGLLTTRRDRSQWLSNGTLLPFARGSPVGSATNDGDELLPVLSDNGRDWDYLNKWDDVYGSSAILPVYGESGSEGDYDSDTWREMKKEDGILLKPLGRAKRLRGLSVEESTNAIDQAISQMVEDWNQKRLPNLSRTAWTIWSKSRRDESVRETVVSLEHEIQHLEIRLNKLRKEIAEQHWLSVARVRRQCESMRRTVYGVQESRWTTRILQLEQMPMRPRRLHMGKKNESTLDMEAAQVELDISETSADEDLGGFVVDDDVSSSHGGNGGLANTSNEDIVMNQSSAPNNDSDDEHSISESSQRQPNISVESGEPDVSTSMQLKKEIIAGPVTPKVGTANFVDLTLSDISESESAPHSKSSKLHSIRTPFVHSADIDENEEPSQRSERKRAEFKIPPGTNVAQHTVIDLDIDETYESDTEQTVAPELPELYETKEISEMDPRLLMEREDRKRLLIYILAQKDLQQRKDAYTYITNHDLARTQKGVWNVFPLLRLAQSTVLDKKNARHNEILKNITAWYICWTSAEIIKPHDGASQEQIDLAEAEKEGFRTFYDFLQELRCLCDFEHSQATTSDKQSKQRRILMDYSDEESPVKRRKYAVPESQEAADTRQKAHRRLADREKRQLRLKRTLQRMGKTEEDPSQVVVNMGKLDHQELIYLLPSIGEKIQPHQKDGLRFLWREIIEDHASQQGCLLAQTMGLGKTMQVISFLVTVAHAARSANANIRQQIPPRLRKSQTIVLCPPTLVENWYDEFLIWAPDKLADNIGDVRTVSSAMQPSERLHTIRDWGEEGGVLVLPFSILRSMIKNPIRKGQAQLDETEHSMVKRILLERPSIVVADEAHTFKNHTSKINRIMSQFGSPSRIALTGSPLSNSLSEYYALIEWIAPGYLGEPTEFRSRYEEPISQGLYSDSTRNEWRHGLKKLELFKREVAPKIHRADLSVLQTSLNGKSEFIIKVSPTDLQHQLYQVFVNSMTEQYGGTQGLARLWYWICILRLICNHPKCYYDKLQCPPTKGPVPAPGAEVAANDDQSLVDRSPLDLGVPEEDIRRQLEPFKNLSVPLTHVSLANKMRVLLQILDLSIAAGDKILVFSHSLQTLDYIENLLLKEGKQYVRMDGSVRPDLRQQLTKKFNQYGGKDVFIISTRAGGTGLNLAGANRVVIMDDNWNPTWEEQAVGRAYRIGQTKPVFVYRLTVGGSFEEVIHNLSLFKQQLMTRVVDKKNIARSATRGMKDYFQPLKTVEQSDLKPFVGKDPDVLDYILASQNVERIILNIVPCETFQQEIDEKLSEEEQKEVELEEADGRLRRADPVAYHARLVAHSATKNTDPVHPRGTQEAPRHSGAAMPVHPDTPPGPERVINTGSTAGIASPPLVDLVPPKPPSAGRGLSNTAKLFGDLVPHGTSVSTVNPLQVNGSSPQGLPRAVPPTQPPMALQHPMLPVLGAGTTSRTGGSLPPKQQHDNLGATRRAESEPWPITQSPEVGASPSKEAWAKYPKLQGLLDREAKRTKRP
ncbi:MAG: hypothetical protein Q9171_006055 [Xanthocarpia ochracea]